jgi:hypothetical protein
METKPVSTAQKLRTEYRRDLRTDKRAIRLEEDEENETSGQVAALGSILCKELRVKL